jgi:uncharacterized protein YidB (DUF937 family)
MDFMEIATGLLEEQLGSGVDMATAQQAMEDLLGNGDQGLDIAGIVGKMTENGDLAGVVTSWLGDGANSGIDASQLMELFGSEKIAGLASLLGLEDGNALQVIGQVLSNLIDQNSSGGNLLESAGGLGGALDLAKKLF